MAQQYVTIEEYLELKHQVSKLQKRLAELEKIEKKEEKDEEDEKEDEEEGWTWECCNDLVFEENECCSECHVWMCRCDFIHEKDDEECDECECKNPAH
jgi:hypothetical protein